MAKVKKVSSRAGPEPEIEKDKNNEKRGAGSSGCCCDVPLNSSHVPLFHLMFQRSVFF